MLQTLDRSQEAFAFDIERVLKRYVRDSGLSIDVAAEHEVELKRFLILCATGKNGPYGMMGPVDDLWHTFLLFTKDYMRFCNVLGKQFIHHEPDDSDKPESLSTRNGYVNFLNDYEKMFGATPPNHIWPRFGTDFQDGEGCNGCHGCSDGIKAAINVDPKTRARRIDCEGCTGCGVD